MKKLLSLLLILSFLITLVGCKSKNKAQQSLNGTELTNYSIVYSDEDYDYSKRAAEYIQTSIEERTGIEIALVEDSESAVTSHEIVVGNTERPISEKLDADTEGLEFAIMAEGNQIALEGDYFIIAAAAYFFIETYIPSNNFKTVVPEGVSIHTPIVKEAKNYIMLIGDGMGINQTKMFQYLENDIEYSDGEDVFYGYYLPYQGYSRTKSLSGVTDSAAGGTALSCGLKTINGNIGRDKDLNDVQSLTELASTLGMATGVMSTEVKTGATPASFSAHADNRNSTAEILMNQTQGSEIYGTIVDCNYNYYTDKYVREIEKKINNMLDTLDNDEDGFFLMYEEAHIDKHCHNNELDNAYQAVVRFNQAIGIFMEYAFYNPDTFIIITADHETGDLFPNNDGVLEYHSGDHTANNVPVFAYGYGAELFGDQKIENIQIPQTIASFWGVYDFGDQSEFTYLGK